MLTLEGTYPARAFDRLPERWRAVLRHTEVEAWPRSPTGPGKACGQMYVREHIAITESPCAGAGLTIVASASTP